MKGLLKFLGISFFILYSVFSYAATTLNKTPTSQNLEVTSFNNENKVPPYYGLSVYNPNYILPFYYTGSPDNVVYAGNTPYGESLKHDEFKYQFSFKVPVWQNMFNWPASLYLAYTQLSYFQLYNTHTFFRENDYEPEVFIATTVNHKMGSDWLLNFINLGAIHESNGAGTDLQRGWDRLYVEAIASSNHWMVSLQPWYIIDTNDNNDNIGKYMGYLRSIVAVKFYHQVVALEARNIIEHDARYATAQLTWSIPITKYIKGYAQVFSGYGQSLIEYDHRTNSAGIGIALSDWV